MKRRLPDILALVILLAGSLCSQEDGQNSGNWQIKPVVNSGFIMIHRASIAHLVKGYPTIFELNVSKQTPGNKLWQLENNNPELGLTFQVMDYKNPEQLGKAYTLAPYIEIPLRGATHRARLHMRLCWGLTYLTKVFDINTNRKNIAIGSHWNCFAQFRWFWQIGLSKNIRFEPGITFSHASNGKIRNPNLGLNVVSLNLGLNFRLPSEKSNTPALVDSSTKSRAKNELLVFAAGGFNQKFINDPLVSTLVISASWQRNSGNKHKYSLGTDVFRDENFIGEFYRINKEDVKGFDKVRISVRAGYSYNVGRLSFPVELGYYVHQKFNPDGMFVTRVGMRYYSGTGIVAHFGLRTHFAVAYNFEFGLGYRFNLK